MSFDSLPQTQAAWKFNKCAKHFCIRNHKRLNYYSKVVLQTNTMRTVNSIHSKTIKGLLKKEKHKNESY